MGSKAPYQTKQMAQLLTYLKTVEGTHVTVADVCSYFKEQGICLEISEEEKEKEQEARRSVRQALEMAEEQQLDLVKIAPQAKPPVCKIMDYGKYRFEQSKREREIRKNQKVIEVKEVRLSATIEDHDVDVRVKNAVKFLKDGNKVKVTIRFRGRQITHSEIGREVMQDFAERIKDYGTVDKGPMIEGRNMSMFVSPKDAN